MNIIETMNSIFSLFSDEKSVYNGYYLSDESGKDKNWIKYSKIISVDVLNYSPFLVATIKFNSNYYFLLYDKSNCNFQIRNHAEIDINAGLFSIIIMAFKEGIKPKITDDEIKEYIFYTSPTEDNDYCGHSHIDLMKYFDNMYVYKCNDDHHELDKFILDLCLQNIPSPTELITDHTKSLYQDLLPFSDVIPIRNLSRSLLHIQPEQMFLELYKLIERLYQIPYIYELHTAINSSDFWLLYKTVPNSLKWNHKELNAFEKLIKEISATESDSIKNKIKQITSSLDDVNIASYIYNIRCRIVHESFIHNHIKLMNDEWAVIIQSLLLIIKSLYQKYKPVLATAI